MFNDASFFRQNMVLSTSATIFHCVFEKTSSTESGGAILFKQPGASLTCSSSFFIETRSDNRGAAICAYESDTIHLIKLCYYLCNSLFSPTFVIWSDYHDISKGVVNYSSEYSIGTYYHGSTFGGRSLCFSSYCSVSDFKQQKTTLASFSIWIYLSPKNGIASFDVQFIEMKNCTGFDFTPIALISFGATTARMRCANFISCEAQYVCHASEPENYKFCEICVITCNVEYFQNFDKSKASYESCFCDKYIDDILSQTKGLKRYEIELNYCLQESVLSCVVKAGKTMIHSNNLLFTTIILGIKN